MKVMILGNVFGGSLLNTENINFVDKPEDADYVILSDNLKSYFVGTQLGELIERAYSLEFLNGSPKVMSYKDFKNEFNNTNQVSL